MALTESNNQLRHWNSAPDFSLKSTEGEIHSLKNFKNANAILIVFVCNHCPYVLKNLEELNRIHEDYKDKGLIVIGVNSNDPDYEREDSYENMQKMVSSGKIKFLYLFDESQQIAKDYGAVCTPDPFLFDKNRKLIFHSRIPDMHQAILEYLDSGKIEMEEKPSIGCSIKWK